MEEKLHYDESQDESGFQVIEGTGVAIKFTNFREDLVSARSTANEGAGANSTDIVKDPTFPSEEIDQAASTNQFVKYGLDNLFPQNIEKIIRRNSKLKVGLATTAKDLIGLGIESGEYDYQNNKKLFVPKAFAKFDEFYDRANVLRNYTILAARQLKTHYMLFVCVMLTKDGSKVGALKTIPTKKCRLDKVDSEGKHKECYVSAHWHEGITDVKNDKRVKTYEVIDTFFDSAEELKKKVKGSSKREFMYVVKFPTEEDVYALADWVSVIEQGWVDSSNDVPEFKRWLLKNLTTVPQIMYINERYWGQAYADWGDLEKRAKLKGDDGQKALATMKTRRESLIKEIKEKLTGISKSGNMITSPMLSQIVGNQAVETKAITIETIKTDDYTGKYNADANEADAQILFALSIDPSRFGNLTRTDSQGGTGKREGHNIAQAMEYIFEELLLEILYFKRDYDQEPDQKKMQLRIRRAVTPTLDNITPSKREINPTET